MNNIPNIAFIVGIVLGSIAIIVVCWVWMRYRVMGIGGGTLSLVGIILIGLCVWSNVKLSITPEGITAELEKKIKEVASAQLTLTEEVENIATNINSTKNLISQLSIDLKSQNSISNDQFTKMRTSINSIPNINIQKLQRTKREIKILRDSIRR